MPTASAHYVGTPVGEEVMSEANTLTAVVHNGFPGVLLLLDIADGQTLRLPVYRRVSGSDEWQRVRSASPVRLEQGFGAAYDVEAMPGQTITYRLGYYGFTDPNPPEVASQHQVTVSMQPWGSCEAWLKHLGNPDLSQRVRITGNWEPSRDSWASVSAVYGGPNTVTDGWDMRGLTGTLSLRSYREQDFRALDALLRASGDLLLQPSPDHGIDPFYLARTGIGYGRPGNLKGYRLRDFNVPVVELPRPVDYDQLTVVPGGTWDDYGRRGLAWLGTAYGDVRNLLLELVRAKWDGGRLR